jgi:hypothetical protein
VHTRGSGCGWRCGSPWVTPGGARCSVPSSASPRCVCIHVRSVRSVRWFPGVGNSQLRATSGPNQEPRSPNVELIGCQSVRQWSSFLSLRTDVRAKRSCEPCYHLLLVSETVRRGWGGRRRCSLTSPAVPSPPAAERAGAPVRLAQHRRVRVGRKPRRGHCDHRQADGCVPSAYPPLHFRPCETHSEVGTDARRNGAEGVTARCARRAPHGNVGVSGEPWVFARGGCELVPQREKEGRNGACPES